MDQETLHHEFQSFLSYISLFITPGSKAEWDIEHHDKNIFLHIQSKFFTYDDSRHIVNDFLRLIY